VPSNGISAVSRKERMTVREIVSAAVIVATTDTATEVSDLIAAVPAEAAVRSTTSLKQTAASILPNVNATTANQAWQRISCRIADLSTLPTTETEIVTVGTTAIVTGNVIAIESATGIAIETENASVIVIVIGTGIAIMNVVLAMTS